MSLINDALKRAQQSQPSPPAGPSVPPVMPRRTTSPAPSLPPAAPAKASPVIVWLIPTLLIFLVVAGLFFAGWMLVPRSVNRTTSEMPAAPAPVASAEPVKPETPPAPAAPAVAAPPATPKKAPTMPKLQGIFYSPTTPSAIVDGQTVRPGDVVGSFRVKEISTDAVTLAGPDGRIVRLGMNK
jgi:hypothetical protein